MESLLEDFQVEYQNPSKRWRRAVAILNNPSLRFSHIAYLVKQNEAERKKQSIQVNIRIEEEAIIGIQPCSDSPPTSPDNYYSCPEVEPDDDRAFDWSEINVDHSFASTSVQHVSPGHNENHDIPRRRDFISFSVQHVSPGHNENHDTTHMRDGSKIEVLELTICLANPIVELMSIVFDQLSSQHKAPFLLLCLIMSILAVLNGISELVYKLIKERDARKKAGSWQRWLHIPMSPGARVGFFPYIIALTCAFGQFIITTVNYSLYCEHGSAPIKISIWFTIFAFGQLFSLLSCRGAKTEIIVNQVPPP